MPQPPPSVSYALSYTTLFRSLLLPAAILLVTFTHYPTAATLFHSFFSTAKPSRPSVWVGADNYRAMVEDPVFWQVDRKSTRLNSSHRCISYAVFCLKKKTFRS